MKLEDAPAPPDLPVVPPPSSATVDYERKPVLFLPNGRVLVRRAGF